MSTLNGIGTLYYDWQSNRDGTANATKWFVVFFLPVVPLRRERLQVLRTDVKRSGVLETILAIAGSGSGFETRIAVLGTISNSMARIIRTYLLAYLVVPLVAFGLPVMVMAGLMLLIETLGFNIQQVMAIAFPVFGILLCAWIGVFVASILDRCAGRKHAARQSTGNPTYRRTGGTDWLP